MRLAYFSPLSPQRSGISDYSEELLPYLAKWNQITLFVDGFKPNREELTSVFEIVDYQKQPASLAQLSQFDAIIYHLGNDHRYHTGILETMRSHPGIVVLHDFALQDFFLGLARERRDHGLYLDEVAICYGERLSKEAAEALHRGAVPAIVNQPLEFPLNQRILQSAKGIIVHSEWARSRLSSFVHGVPIRRISMPLKFSESVRAANHPGDEIQIANFGLITPGKGIELALRALSQLKRAHRFRYTLVGEANEFYDVRGLIERYGVSDLVEITGHLNLEDFKQRIDQTDIALNLRERTVGETSASLCRLMAGGVCSVVADVGWYSELPSDCVVKVPLDSYTDKLLLAYLERLIEDEKLRRQIGANARAYARVEHALEHGAAEYQDFISHVADRAKRKLIRQTSDELVKLGIKPADEVILRSVAAELCELVPALDPPPPSTNGKRTATSKQLNGRTPKVEGIDYKKAARAYFGRLSEERSHHLRTKPFYNLAHKPAKYKNQGMDEDMHRHFCDFANMAVTLALPAGSRILDVGCGSGWLSEYFARIGYVVKGIDISPSLIEMSRERVARVPYGVDHETPLRCSFEVHDVELSALTEKFDAVICYDSLHHFEDERAVMRHIAQMLDVGGVLFILEGERPAAGSHGEAELQAVMNEFQTLESPFDYSYLKELSNENGLAIVGDYVAVDGLFERELVKDDRLPLKTVATNYHYLACKKVIDGAPAATVPDSRNPGLLRAHISLRQVPNLRVAPGENIALDLEIENTGDTLWLSGRETRTGIVMPAIRIFDERKKLLSEVHGEPPLPHAVAPGEKIKLMIECAAPADLGIYELKTDLVDEEVCWFEDEGSQPLTIEIGVVGNRPA